MAKKTKTKRAKTARARPGPKLQIPAVRASDVAMVGGTAHTAEPRLPVAVMEADPVLYLDEALDFVPIVTVVIPPDLERCQCEWPDPAATGVGPRPWVRCTQTPTVLAFQKRPSGGEAPTGVMSLCEEHRIVVEHMYPGQAYYRKITPEKRIGGYC
jgi:hypothetical protein